MSEEKAAYYADAKGRIWKAPVRTKNDDGTTSITMGFPCATAHEAVGQEGAETMAAMLCQAQHYPALLAALKEAEEGLDYLRCYIADLNIDCSEAFKQRWIDAQTAARAAIEQAEGR